MADEQSPAAFSEIPLTIGDGYTVFPIELPSTPLLPWTATHYMYLRAHQPKVADAATGRSLFVVNVPFDSTPQHLKHLFSTQLGLPAGRIAGVEFHDRHEQHASDDDPARIVTPEIQATAAASAGRKRKRDDEQNLLDSLPPLVLAPLPQWDREIHRPGTNAVVVFVDRTSMDAALRAAKTAAKNYVHQDVDADNDSATTGKKRSKSKSKEKEKRKESGSGSGSGNIIWGDGIEDQLPPLGKQRYKRHEELMYPGDDVMYARAEEYLKAYDAHMAARDKVLAEQRQMPDEDGFITVTRSGNKGGVRGVKQDAAKERLEKQRQKQENLTDFYRFQGRERAKQRAKELVNKFNEDVEKVRKMRERNGKTKIT